MGREQFISLLDGMSLVFGIYDRDLVIRYLSRQMLVGNPPLTVGRRLDEQVPIDPRQSEAYKRVFETGKEWSLLDYQPIDPRFPRLHVKVFPLGDEIVVVYEDAEALEER